LRNPGDERQGQRIEDLVCSSRAASEELLFLWRLEGSLWLWKQIVIKVGFL